MTMETDKHPLECFHCELMEIIRRRYPTGIDKFDAHEILCGMAVVVGDILSNGNAAQFHGFVEIVQFKAQEQGKLKFIDRALS